MENTKTGPRGTSIHSAYMYVRNCTFVWSFNVSFWVLIINSLGITDRRTTV